MHRTNIYLSEEQEAVLDSLAEAAGTSRSEVIRRILDEALFSENAPADEALRVMAPLVRENLEALFVDDADLAIE